ncbi:fibronectin type III domain-containing protein [Planococcus koreensis]|uniref:fibronectin type III domain-containing protein n=1 Tax=Planococcus koreensis TaxID=112331 RepID=UPI001081C9A5|nr:fibronectin type III domain-containing protein [Planococcus koreensis]
MKTFNNRSIKKGMAALLLSLVVGSSAAAMNMAQADGHDAVVTDVSMAPGQDETEMNFSWYAPETSTPGVLEVRRVDAEGTTQTVTAELKKGASGFSGNEAQITGLVAEAQYEYRIGDGKGHWYETSTFSTRDTESFNFLLMGDRRSVRRGSCRKTAIIGRIHWKRPSANIRKRVLSNLSETKWMIRNQRRITAHTSRRTS